jgi:pimeloyl-ACP methyl ester carboxylesterase
MAGMEPVERQTEADSINWRYLEWNPTGRLNIVLVHGITSTARGWWRVGPSLAEMDARVIAVNMPGHGGSSESRDGTKWERTGAQLAAFIEGLNLKDYRLAGHSWGGIVSLYVAAHHPSSLFRVALLDPVLYLEPERSEKAGAGYDAQVNQPKLSRQEYLEQARLNMPTWSECDHYWKAEAMQNYQPATVRDYFWHNLGHNVTQWLAQVNVPLLLMIANEQLGGVLPPDVQAQSQAALRPNLGEIVKLESAGHNLHREDYDGTMQHLKPFLLA